MRKRERLEKNCKCCDKLIPNNNVYCDNTCQSTYQYNKYITEWLDGNHDGRKGKFLISNHIRRWLFEKYENKCGKCGWDVMNKYTGNIPLEVNHIDGQHINNRPENLELLCPNCHSLTETFRNTNNRTSTRVGR